MIAKFKFVLLLIFTLASTQLAAYLGAPINPISWPDAISDEMRLGKKLFFDKKLSADGATNCASCHQFHLGGSVRTSRPLTYSGNTAPRNATSIFNLNPDYKLGWLANIRSAHEQLDKLISAGKVMGLKWPQVVERLQADSEYRAAFQQIYAAPISAELITRAIVAYELALTTPSPFDRFLQGDEAAISERAKEGFELFKHFGCIACHQGRNVGGNLIQKLGVIRDYPVGEGEAALGRYSLTGRNEDRQVFRVPSLRNVANSAPYLHDGSIEGLSQVIKLMGRYQLGTELSDSDVLLLETFLQTLSGQPHPELVP